MADLRIRVTGINQAAGGTSRSPDQAAARQEALLRRTLALQLRLTRNARQFQRTSTAAFSRIALQTQRVGDTIERGWGGAIRRVERQGIRAAARLRTAFAAVGRGLSRAGSRVGGIGAALGPLAGGGGITGLLSGAARSAGNLARVGAQAATDLVGGITSGLARAVPVVGRALGGLLEGAFQVAGSVVGGVVQFAGDLAGRFVEAFSGVARVGLIATIGAAIGASVQAARFEGVERAFESLSETIGASAESLEDFREATRGTVSDTELLRLANQAIQLGAVETADQFSDLASAARRLGRAVGVDAAQSVDRLILGLGRRSPRILDDLGIRVGSLAEIYENFGRSVGRSADELTDAEKQTAFLRAAIDGINDRVANLGEDVLSTADRWDQFTASISNTAVAIGQALKPAVDALLPVLRDVVEDIGEFFRQNREAVGADLATSIRNAGEEVRKFTAALRTATFDDVRARIEAAVVDIWDTALAQARRFFAEVRALARDAGDDALDLIPFVDRSESRARTARDLESARATASGDSARILRAEEAQIAARISEIDRSLASLRDILESARRPDIQRAAVREINELTDARREERAAIVEVQLDLLDLQAAAQTASEALTGENFQQFRLAPSAGTAIGRALPLDVRTGQQERIQAGFEREQRVSVPTRILEQLSDDAITQLELALAAATERRIFEEDILRATGGAGRIARLEVISEERERIETDIRDERRRARDAAAVARRAAEDITRLTERRDEIESDFNARLEDITSRAAAERERVERDINERFARRFEQESLSTRGGRFEPPNLRRGRDRRARREDAEIRRRISADPRISRLSAGDIARLSPEDFARLEATVLGIVRDVRRPDEEARRRVAEREAPREFAPEILRDLTEAETRIADREGEDIRELEAATKKVTDEVEKLLSERLDAFAASSAAFDTISGTINELVELEKRVVAKVEEIEAQIARDRETVRELARRFGG